MINYSGKKIFIFLLIFCLHYNIFSQETNNSATSTYNIVCSELKQLDLRFKILDTVRFYTECFPKNIIISFENQNSDRNLYIFATQELFCKAKNQFINYIHFLEKEKKNVNYYLVLYSDNEEQVIKNHQAGFEAYINSLDYKENSYAIILKYAEKKSKIENFTSDGSLTPLNFIKFINKAYIEHNKSFSLFTYYPLIKDKNIILDSNKNTLLFDRNIISCILPFNCSAQDFSIIKSISNNFSNYDLLQDSPKVYSNINFGKYNIWITEAWFVTFTLIIILAFCLLFIVFTTAKAAGNTNSIITKNNLINNLSAKYVYLSILEITFYLISIVVFQNIFRSLILHPKIYLFFKLILPSIFIFIFYSFRINKNYFIELEQIGYIQIVFSFLSRIT